MGECLEIRDAVKRYSGGLVAVDGVSLTAGCDTVTALLGPNGREREEHPTSHGRGVLGRSGVFLVAGLEV